MYRDPEWLLRMYDANNVTESELRYRLVQAAAVRPPEEIAAVLPAEVLRAMQDESAAPPESQERSPRIDQAGSWIGPRDWKTEMEENQRLWFEGVWRWHRYFESGAGGPPAR